MRLPQSQVLPSTPQLLLLLLSKSWGVQYVSLTGRGGGSREGYIFAVLVLLYCYFRLLLHWAGLEKWWKMMWVGDGKEEEPEGNAGKEARRSREIGR